MARYKVCHASKLFRGLIVLCFMAILSGNSFAANYGLEIIQPRANLDTSNRFYKAYPGLEYNVRFAVIGGVYPYRYELTSSPQGMSIDGRGEITWANPIESGSPYNVTVNVTDAEFTTRSVSWSITVTTDGFRFIDAVNGTPATEGGSGTITNPWKSMKDMYGGTEQASKNTSEYSGEFVYWRDGTYEMDAYREDSGRRTPFVSNNKPQVWLAYPGESPVIDLENAYISIYAGGTNTYFDGLEFKVNSNERGMGIVISSSASHVTFRRNKLHGITNGSSGGNNSLIFIGRDSVGSYYSFQDNVMSDVNNGYGILGYSARNVLIEDNELSQIHAHPIGPKEGTARWDIRKNEFYENNQDSIGLQYSNTGGVQSGDIEISYNLIHAGGGKVRINSNFTTAGLPVYVFRNTIMDEVDVNKATSSNGVFSFTRNVIVNETSHPSKIERVAIEDSSQVVIADNLTGSRSDNIVDENGFLTPDYSMYVGSHGHQIGHRPMGPSSVIKVIEQ